MNIDPTKPVNKLAARVVSKYENPNGTTNPGAKIFSMSPLPTTQFNGPRKDDLTGQKAGRYTVIGCALFRPNNWRTSPNSTRWVVRCSCGRYAILTTKAIKKNHPQTMCIECTKIQSLKASKNDKEGRQNAQ